MNVDESKVKKDDNNEPIIEKEVLEETKEIEVVEEKDEKDEKIEKSEENKEIEKEEVKEEIIINDEIEKIEDIEEEEDEEEFNGEDASLGFFERCLRFETDTKIGLITGAILFIAIIFNWEWINHTWWLVLALAGSSLRFLNKQRNELKEEKPFESKISNLSFIVLIIILIVRDLIITHNLS